MKFAVLWLALVASATVSAAGNRAENLGERRRTHQGVYDRQSVKPRSGNKHSPRAKDARSSQNHQMLPCTLILLEVDYEGGRHEGHWQCELQGYDAELAGGEPGSTVVVDIEGGDRIWSSGRDIETHLTTLHAVGAFIQNGRLVISDDTELLFGEEPHRRRLAPKTGNLKNLVVRVTSNDGQPTDSAAEMSGYTYGNEFSLHTVINGCSWGKVNIVPATGANIVNGVLEMRLNVNTNGGDSQALHTTVLNELKSKYSVSDLKSKFDLVQVVFPRGTHLYDDTDWVGFADFNSFDSMYNDQLFYPNLAMHEVGHNWGLEHGVEGADEYGDDTGAMGSANNGGKVCLSGAHSSYMGWYSGKEVEKDPVYDEFDGKLAGVGKYPGIQDDEYVILKLTASSVGHYWIMFNHKIGANSDVEEAPNQVTVVSMERLENTFSTLKAKLGPGGKYTIPNYDGTGSTVTVEVVSINSSASGFAHVKVYKSGNSSPSTSTASEAASSSCTNLAGWVEETYGSTCDWYNGEEPGCPGTGNDIGYVGDGDDEIPASVACCRCKE